VKEFFAQRSEELPKIVCCAAMVFLMLACSPVSLLNATISRSGYRIERDLSYGGDPRQKLDLYVPDGLKSPAPVLLFFYGGIWQSGTKDYYLALGQAFATRGVVVAIADYRLYPQVRYPAFVEDGAMAFRTLRDSVAKHGGDPSRVFVAGHSAGAYIAVMLASDSRYLAAVHENLRSIRGVIGIAGPYDFLPLKDRNLVAIFGGADRGETQPIHYIDGSRPPMLLVAGAADTTVLPRNTLRMAERLRAVGSEVTTEIYPGVGHVGILLTFLSSKSTLRDDMVQFIATH
jgi:acetyl esterase/lipase